MFYRIALLAVTLFWLTMSFLLWRAEYGGRNRLGSTVPLEVVWRKMLTAPDNSSLDVFHHGQKAGYCRWAANVGLTGNLTTSSSDDTVPEGMVQRLSGYRLDVEGNVAPKDPRERIHFNLDLQFNPGRDWKELNLRVYFQKNTFVVHSVAAEQAVRLHAEYDGEKLERTMKFTDLQDPRALTQAFALSLPVDLMGFAEPAPGNRPAGLLPVGFNWEARNDWLTIGHTQVRAYRLQARLLDRYEAVVIVSPVGEILRVELPDEWVLINDQLGML